MADTLSSKPHGSVAGVFVLRKARWRLIPLLAVCYGVAYIDRVKVGDGDFLEPYGLGLAKDLTGNYRGAMLGLTALAVLSFSLIWSLVLSIAEWLADACGNADGRCSNVV